ncbi:multidrug resistance-associated protein 1-like [Dermacentor silvarum]|uniref:multidrug resistance-associated protein 1-like n=1 Tax=Dermacentor silvarum TaxID=543639 RepID=UPI002100BD03|nr:multidrug resistance-associated protein 1-like [Dermacentor silvarum]
MAGQQLGGLRDSTAYQGFLDEDSVSPFARIACLCLFVTFKEAGRKEKSKLQIPHLRRGVRCKRLVHVLTSRLPRGRTPRSPKIAFLGRAFSVLWIDLLRILLSNAAYYFCIFARIPALELLINSRGKNDLMLSSLLFMATCVGECLLSSYNLDLIAITGSRIRALLQGVIFRKATLLSPADAQPTGYVASLMGVDIPQLCNCLYTLLLPGFGALTLPILFWMLSERAGAVPAICCAAWAIVTLLAPMALLYAQKRFWDVEIKARDERLKLITDVLCNVRVVKMYAWEDAMQENVLRSRKVELRNLLAINVLNSVLDALCSSCSSVMMIILFSTMSVFEPDRALSPELTFSCIALLYITDLMANGLALLFRNLSKGAVALKRISGFCTAEEYGEEKESQEDCFSTKGTSVRSKWS